MSFEVGRRLLIAAKQDRSFPRVRRLSKMWKCARCACNRPIGEEGSGCVPCDSDVPAPLEPHAGASAVLGACAHAPTGSISEARFLKTLAAMLAWVGIAVTVLASPAGTGATQALSPEVLSPTLVRHAPERTATAVLEGWLTNLAVVRPARGGVETSSMLLFVAGAPVGRHGMGIQVIGSF